VKFSIGGVTKLITFVLLIIGTVGLLVNEFVFDWGRVATVVFAAMNVLGLIFLVYTNWGKKGKK